MVTRQGASWANALGSVGELAPRRLARRRGPGTSGPRSDAGASAVAALLYSAFGVAIEKARGAEDDVNTVAAGTLTGMVFKSAGGSLRWWE